MSTTDPIFAAVTGTGSPFEIGERDGLRQFVSAPPDLNLLIEAARAHGDKTFIVEEEHRLSFEDVFQRRDALAGILGIEPGNHVAICMRNCSEWMIAFMAVVRLGGVAVLINSRGAPDELIMAIEDAEVQLVLADEKRADLIRKGGYEGAMVQAENFPRKPTNLPENTAEYFDKDPNKPCAILFTSGTTGRVKGAVLSHKNLITGIMSMQLSGLMVLHNMANQMGIGVDVILANMPQQAVLQIYPLFHISGLGAAFLSPLFAGSKIVIRPRWDPIDAMQVIAEEKITQLTGVPTMLWDIVKAAEGCDADLSSLRNIGTGGQALPVNLLDAIRGLCPAAVMGTGYGMTECSGSVAMAVGEDFVRNRASAGRVLNLVDMRILDSAGRELPVGEPGEIVVKGAMVMQGYWNNASATAEVLSDDGWLNTGDIGYVDEEGYVFIVDRKKDMVISGGENIYSAEVERVMGEIAQVIECAVFGIADERLGERLAAVVVANDIDEQGIKQRVSEQLAKYKVPENIAFSTEDLPRNAVGKIDKVKLRARWPELAGEKA